MWGERTRRPPAQILGHIDRGRRMDAGRSRVSVRRNAQALSGVVIRQRPRVGSRAVIPSPRLAAPCYPRTRPCGPSIVRETYLIHVEEAAVLDRLGAMRGPGESYSDVILKLVEADAHAPVIARQP
jgi:hypothetical protein